jgi:hypothetical protein
VNSASRADTTGILAGKGQADTTFDPAGVFAYGQTYYWRIDEVNKSADATVSKGAVWSFTAEPYGYPITGITATASSSAAGMGPENTINGSGLDKSDLHGTDGTTMWLSAGAQPNWIQYQFDKVYKLVDLKVWNSNQLIESFLGFGAKNVTVETSTDGTTWTALANVPDFAKAPGMAGYAANTTVSFGGVMAKYVKLTINSNWGGMASQTGLSEVRFSYVPVLARAPQPATAATGVTIDTTLTWRPGREADSHKVYFGADQAAVTNGTVAAKTVAGHSYAPGSLTFGTTYYWRVDEVNTVTYPGDLWSFTTQEFAVVDDFESYTDTDNRIYDTWIDGWTNGTGSVVGYLQAPFAEKTILHGGKQSMPMEYNNVKTPFYSEAQRTLDTTQDWTPNGATHLGLWFRGYPAVTSVAVTETAGKMTLTGDGSDIWNNSDDFVYAYKTLTGDGSMIARVTSIGPGTNTWAKAGVMIRDSLNGGSTHAAMCLSANSDGTAGNGYSFQRRLTTDGASSSDDGTAPAVAPPYWVKIQRAGDIMTGSISADGKTWRLVGTPQTIAMTAPVYIGLCVTSHASGEQRTFQFDSISTAGGVSGQWQGAQINSPRYNDAAGLYVIVEDSTGKSKLVAHPDPAAAATGAWTQWTIPLSDLTAAGVKTTKVKKVTIGVGDRSNPKAGAAGMLYIDDIGYGHPLK